MTIHTAVFSAVAVSAAQDLFEITMPSNRRGILREVRLGQYSDFGDAQAELLSVIIVRGNTTTGSGGSSVTPKSPSGDAPSLATVAKNNTTPATGGGDSMLADTFNVAAGWLWAPPERERILVDAGQRCCVRITTPADAITMNGTLTWEETP